jgi:hypothetical protein
MRVWPITGGLVAVALVATAFAVVVQSDPERTRAQERAEAPAERKQLRDAPHDPDAEQRVAEIAATPGIVSERELVDLYALWAGQDDKVWARRKIVDALLALADHRRALNLLLEAVASDETPTAKDEMIEYAADRLQAYWSDPKTYGYGRDLMLVQQAEKPRALLARSLVDYTARLDAAADPEYQKRTSLASDMVDVFYQTKDEDSRKHMLAGLDELGASDMSKLMRSPDLDPKELASVRLHIDTTEQAIADMDDELADEQDADWSGVLTPLRELAGLDREDLEDVLVNQD